MQIRGKKNLGQYPLNELKVPCKNSSSLEIKIKQPKSRHETFMLVAALQLYKLFERDNSRAHPTALQFVSITYAWFNFTCYHPSPGQPPGQVQPFGPGGGEMYEMVLSRG